MTATDQTSAPAAVEPVILGALKLLQDKPQAKLADLAAMVVPVAEPGTVTAAGFPELPKKITLTDKLRDALKKLPKIFGGVDIEVRRALTEDERAALTAEAETIRLVTGILGARDEAIKEMIRVHMDVEAEQAGRVVPENVLDTDGTILVPASPRDKAGHYLQALPRKPHQVPVGGLTWDQQYSAGKASPSAALLEAALEGSQITRPEYLAMTREVRVLDDARITAFIRKSPQRGLEILRKITTRTDPNSALYLRETK